MRIWEVVCVLPHRAKPMQVRNSTFRRVLANFAVSRFTLLDYYESPQPRKKMNLDAKRVNSFLRQLTAVPEARINKIAYRTGLALVASLAVSASALAQTAPNLGSLAPFGVVSSTCTNTAAGTTINGNLCFIRQKYLLAWWRTSLCLPAPACVPCPAPTGPLGQAWVTGPGRPAGHPAARFATGRQRQ